MGEELQSTISEMKQTKLYLKLSIAIITGKGKINPKKKKGILPKMSFLEHLRLDPCLSEIYQPKLPKRSGNQENK